METTVPKYTSAREAWVTKFALRSVSLMLCIIVLGISGTISFAIYARGAFLFGIAAPSLMLAACWDVAEGIAILARDGHRGIHPGANVGMDLVIWLAFAVTEFFLFLSGLENDPASFVRYYDDNNYSYTTGSYDIETDGPQSQEELGAVIADMSRKGKAIIGCMVILIVVHFTTFVFACKETSIRNKLSGGSIILIQDPFGGQPVRMQPVSLRKANGETRAIALREDVYYKITPPGPSQPWSYVNLVPVQVPVHESEIQVMPPPVYSPAEST